MIISTNFAEKHIHAEIQVSLALASRPGHYTCTYLDTKPLMVSTLARAGLCTLYIVS